MSLSEKLMVFVFLSTAIGCCCKGMGVVSGAVVCGNVAVVTLVPAARVT